MVVRIKWDKVSHGKISVNVSLSPCPHFLPCPWQLFPKFCQSLLDQRAGFIHKQSNKSSIQCNLRERPFRQKNQTYTMYMRYLYIIHTCMCVCVCVCACVYSSTILSRGPGLPPLKSLSMPHSKKTTRNTPLIKVGFITCCMKDGALLVEAWGISERGCQEGHVTSRSSLCVKCCRKTAIRWLGILIFL